MANTTPPWVTATTSVTHKGSVRLLARERMTYDQNFLARGANVITASETGKAELGANSVTEVLPELASEKSIIEHGKKQFVVTSGGGPSIMEAANKGAQSGRSPSIGVNIELPQEQRPNTYQDISLHFRHFFARKVMFVKYASAYVVLPGGFGTLDELAEILTLVQTGKTRRIPIVLVGSVFWSGLLDWMRDTLVAWGTISAGDLDLMRVCDEPDDIVRAIFDHYETRSLEPSEDEQEILLEL